MNGRVVWLVGLGLLLAPPVLAQRPPGHQGSSNMEIVAHIPVGGSFNANDLEIEQR